MRRDTACGFSRVVEDAGDATRVRIILTNRFTTREFPGARHRWTWAGSRSVAEKKLDRGRFRTPTLRNVALTGPYMHDGSIAKSGRGRGILRPRRGRQPPSRSRNPAPATVRPRQSRPGGVSQGVIRCRTAAEDAVKRPRKSERDDRIAAAFARCDIQRFPKSSVTR